MKSLPLALFILLLPNVLAIPTFAQYVQYGGITTNQAPKQALVEKKILNPQNNQFVDNLSFEQNPFLPNQDVTFRVTVTNVIQTELRNLQITDRLPTLLNFVSSSFGNFDANAKSISFTINSLRAGENKTFDVKAKVKTASELPANVICQVNLARVRVDNMVDEDSANLCISKQVLGVSSQLPVSGPGQTIPIILLSSLFLTIAYFTKRIHLLEGRL